MFFVICIRFLVKYIKDGNTAVIIINSAFMVSLVAATVYANIKKGTVRAWINGSSIYLGSEYVFDTDGQLFRLCDVKNVYIKEMDNKGLKVYYAAMDISGGSGDGFVIIKRLTGRNEEQRIRQFMEVKEMFGFDGRYAGI